ncbi:MAG: glycosyltransferase family 4 protein [Actinomycetota bacterium]
MRIAYLVRKTSGGMQAHIQGLLSGLDRLSFEPIVISPHSEKLFSSLENLGVDYFRVDMADKISLKDDIISACLVASILRKIRPDILHVHGNKAALIGWLASRFCPPRCMVITIHNFLSGLDRNMGNLDQKPSALALVYKKASKSVLNAADLVIAVSTELGRYLKNEIGVRSNKVSIIPNGIDMKQWEAYRKSSFNARRILGFADNVKLIGTMGRLVPFKGHQVLLKSISRLIKKHSDMHLLVIGDGPLRDELIAQARALGISQNVKFLGFVDEPGQYLAALDVFVLASIAEPFGIAILEAMSLGLPVISTRSGGVVDIIEDRKTGLLVNPSDEASLADAIEELLNNKSLGKTLSQNGQKLVSEKFTIKAMVDKTCAIYNELMYDA